MEVLSFTSVGTVNTSQVNFHALELMLISFLVDFSAVQWALDLYLSALKPRMFEQISYLNGSVFQRTAS